MWHLKNIRLYFSARFFIIRSVFSFLLPSNSATAQIGRWPPLLRFLNQAQLDTRQDSSGRVNSPSLRSLPTQDNTTYKHNTQTSMPSAGLEPAMPGTKRAQTYALDCAATGIGRPVFT
jgi:hypothetical protein